MPKWFGDWETGEEFEETPYRRYQPDDPDDEEEEDD